MIPTLIGVAVIIFLLMRVVPGDVVELRFAGESSFASKETLDTERARLGLLSLYLFANDIGKIKIFPGSGSYVPLSQDPAKWFTSLILPWFVLAASFAAFYARLLRGNLIEVMSEDYIRTARAKGLRERRVVLRHGIRSAITPIVTAAGLDIGILLGGAILTESVFNIPGIGRLAFDSIQNSDLPMIQGTVLLGAFFIVVMNLVVDIAYAFIDPRVRYS